MAHEYRLVLIGVDERQVDGDCVHRAHYSPNFRCQQSECLQTRSDILRKLREG